MEKVLDTAQNDCECKLVKNEIGLYDLTITENGVVIATEKNVYFSRAVAIIEENMYTSRRNRLIET